MIRRRIPPTIQPVIDPRVQTGPPSSPFTSHDVSPRRRTLIELAAISVLCLFTYGFGPTNHGLTNWQEAQRALVAREMFDRGDWLVPHAHGRPYLAKPPLIYWCQLALAQGRAAIGGGSPRPTELDLRITVAIAGYLGVLACYLMARTVVATGWHSRCEQAADGAATANQRRSFTGPSPAFWCAGMLATGFLYVRSSRIGELDILLAPTVTIAIWSLLVAWMGGGSRARRAALWMAGAVAASLAMLAKGPPGLMVIALGTIGAVLVRAAWSRPGNVTGNGGPQTTRIVAWLAAAASLIGVAWLNRGEFELGDAMLGLPVFGLVGAAIARTTMRLANVRALKQVASDLWRMQPLLVLVPPIVAFWVWIRAVAGRIGWDAVEAARDAEASDNLRLLVVESPVNNLQASAFGVGLGSIAVLAFGWWWWRRERRGSCQVAGPTSGEHADGPSPGVWVIVSWMALSLVAFSLLGKGVGRYLTPVWPAIALVGGLAFSRWLATRRRPMWPARGVVMGIVALGVGQAIWYGRLMERYYGSRSPRAIVEKYKKRAPKAFWGTLDFQTPAVNYYLDGPVQLLTSGKGDGPNSGTGAGPSEASTGSPASTGSQPARMPTTPEEWLAAAAESERPWVLLVKEPWITKHYSETLPPWASHLASRYDTDPPHFVIDNGKTHVWALVVWSWKGMRND